MNLIIGAIAGAGLLVVVFLAGVRTEKALDDQRLAAATAAFEQTVREANQAYANQKVADDAELAALKKAAETAPPDPAIAIKKETASRIGAIR